MVSVQRQALVTMFQHWFGAAAEEASETSRVAAYLKEVKSEAPPLLAFLVNLADDNGNTVLHYSVSHCNYGVVSVLLDTGNTVDGNLCPRKCFCCTVVDNRISSVKA